MRLCDQYLFKFFYFFYGQCKYFTGAKNAMIEGEIRIASRKHYKRDCTTHR